MSAEAAEECKDKDVVVLAMEDYHDVLAKQTQFFTTHEPEYVWKQIVTKLNDKDIHPELSEKKFKLNFNKVKELTEEEKADGVAENSFSAQVKLLKVDEGKLCVDFAHRDGNKWYFYEEYNKIKHVLNELNDVAN